MLEGRSMLRPPAESPAALVKYKECNDIHQAGQDKHQISNLKPQANYKNCSARSKSSGVSIPTVSMSVRATRMR